MSDRILDMRAQLQGARQVERELQGLEAQTRKVEAAAGAHSGVEKSLTSTLEAKNEAITQSVKGAEKLFSVTDAVAGVVGKAVGVIGLLNLALDVGVAIYEAAAGAQVGLGDAIEATADKAARARGEVQGLIDASARLAAGAGLIEANLNAEERREARSRELDRVEIKARLIELLREEETVERRVATARVAGGVSALEGELARLDAERERLAFQLEGLDLEDQAVQKAARRREGRDSALPPGPAAGRPARPRGSSNPGLIGTSTAEGDQFETELGPERVGEALAFADGLARVAEELNRVAEAEAEVAAAQKAGTAIAVSYAEASARAGAAAALSAALRGESVVEAVNAVLEGVAVEATVQAAFEVAKGLAASANPLTAATAAGHFAAAKAFGITAAIAGAGALASGGFGAGSAPSSPAEVQAPGAPRGDAAFGRDRDEPSSSTIIIPMDLRSRPLATNNQLARELVRNLNDYGGMPGRSKVNLRRVGG